MLKNLLNKGGNVITRIVSNRFPNSIIVTNNESTIQEVVEEQRICEHNPREEYLEVSFMNIK